MNHQFSAGSTVAKKSSGKAVSSSASGVIVIK